MFSPSEIAKGVITGILAGAILLFSAFSSRQYPKQLVNLYHDAFGRIAMATIVFLALWWDIRVGVMASIMFVLFVTDVMVFTNCDVSSSSSNNNSDKKEGFVNMMKQAFGVPVSTIVSNEMNGTGGATKLVGPEYPYYPLFPEQSLSNEPVGYYR